MSRAEARMQAIEESMKELTVKIEKIISQNDSISNCMKIQEDRLKSMEEKMVDYVNLKADVNFLKSENLVLKKRVGDLEADMEYLKNKENKKMIEINGVPSGNAENIEEIVLSIAKAIKVELTNSDVCSAYRLLGRRGNPGTISVKFKDTEKKLTFLKAAKKVKPKTDMIGYSGNANIFVNEKLTYKTKAILFKLKEIARTKTWARVWVYAGAAFIKLEESGQPIKVATLEEVETLRK